MTALNDLPVPPQGRQGWPWTEAATPLPPSPADGRDWPLVTVVTPSFNQGEFLEETIRSVLLQGYPRLEYIVIDGGSSDGSREVLERYAPWLHFWVSEKDRGHADAVNKGFSRAAGEIYGWVNSDDTYLPGAIAEGAAHLSLNPGVGVVYGDVHFTDQRSGVLNTMRAWNFDLHQQVCATNLVPQPATFFRRSSWEKVKGLEEDRGLALDYDLWVRMALAGVTFGHVPRVWATYRLHPSSKTRALALDFGEDVRKVVNYAFSHGGAPASWRAAAESNCEQLIAETYLRLGHRRESRRHYWRSIRRKPLRLKTLGLMAFIVDPRLGWAARRWRWRQAGRTDDLWRMPEP